MLDTRIKAIILAWSLAILSPAAQADSITPADLATTLDDRDAPLVLDVRSEAEYRSGHVPGAVHIPHDQLQDRLTELPADQAREIVVYCEVGGRASAAAEVLQDAGFTRVLDLEGHMREWRADGRPME